jgi:hypothetical protein|tara:strand:+ start:2157 stop:2693 length:537 start_codon:yes stop_codon:yes gene_type:complete
MNTYTFSISTDTAGVSNVYPTIDLFDITNFSLNIIDVYTDTFPNYVGIDWGDGTAVLEPDVSVFRDYRKDSIYPEITKGVAPKYISDIYKHVYEPSSYALKKTVVLKVNIGYITGETTTLSAPLNIRTEGYYQTVEDIDLIGLDLLNNKYNSSRFTLLTKKDDYIVQLENESYKEDTA